MSISVIFNLMTGFSDSKLAYIVCNVHQCDSVTKLITVMDITYNVN